MPTVVVVDDHPSTCRGLAVIVEELGGTALAQAASISTALTALAAHQPDVLLLDLNLGDDYALDHLTRLRQASPTTRIAIFTMEAGSAHARRALAAGVDGYLLKQTSPDKLEELLTDLMAGRRYFGVEFDVHRDHSTNPPPPLTERDGLILASVLHGLSNEQIARRLVCSTRTIESQRARLRIKLGATSKQDMIQAALERQHELPQLPDDDTSQTPALRVH